MMNDFIDLQIRKPFLQCEECEGTTFWLIEDKQVACSDCQFILDGIEWVLNDE